MISSCKTYPSETVQITKINFLTDSKVPPLANISETCVETETVENVADEYVVEATFIPVNETILCKQIKKSENSNIGGFGYSKVSVLENYMITSGNDFPSIDNSEAFDQSQEKAIVTESKNNLYKCDLIATSEWKRDKTYDNQQIYRVI